MKTHLLDLKSVAGRTKHKRKRGPNTTKLLRTSFFCLPVLLPPWLAPILYSDLLDDHECINTCASRLCTLRYNYVPDDDRGRGGQVRQIQVVVERQGPVDRVCAGRLRGRATCRGADSLSYTKKHGITRGGGVREVGCGGKGRVSGGCRRQLATAGSISSRARNTEDTCCTSATQAGANSRQPFELRSFPVAERPFRLNVCTYCIYARKRQNKTTPAQSNWHSD